MPNGYANIAWWELTDDPHADQEAYKAFEDFRRDPRWQAWFTENVPGDWTPLFSVEKRQGIALSRVTSQRIVELRVPISEFTNGDTTRGTFRRLTIEMWRRAAKRYKWPMPPDVPPVQLHLPDRSNEVDEECGAWSPGNESTYCDLLAGHDGQHEALSPKGTWLRWE